MIKLFTVYFLISRLELRIIYRGDDRRCLDYRFDDALSHCTTFSPASVISGLLSRPSKDIESFHRRQLERKHERIVLVVTRTIHLIIQPTRGCIIVALIIPITVQLSFTCNAICAGDVMHSLASTQ